MKTFLAILLGGAFFSVNAEGIDAVAAKALAKGNSCLTCHGENKDKEGLGFNNIAKKYKGDKDAVAKLTTHLTTNPKVKFKDGHEEAHKALENKTDADKSALKNLIDWILSH